MIPSPAYLAACLPNTGEHCPLPSSSLPRPLPKSPMDSSFVSLSSTSQILLQPSEFLQEMFSA